MKRSALSSVDLTPPRLITAGFSLITLVGAVLLMLPISSKTGMHQPFIDALFTSASAVTTTGLVVVDTGKYYTTFGQLVILTLIQIGGLGYMVFMVLITTALGRRLSFKSLHTLKESLGTIKGDAVRYTKLVLLFTLIIEGAGALGFSILFAENHVRNPIYSGIFHSISAFCTAGFSLMSDSFSSFVGSIPINIWTDIVSILGALGFFVLYDLYMLIKKKRTGLSPARLSTHSKIVLSSSAAFMLLGSVFVMLFERSISHMPFTKKLLASTFQVISASTTTGFNSIAIGKMGVPALMVLSILMFIGASPGSTGGGIKTTTFSIMTVHLFSFLKGEREPKIFGRSINIKTVEKAFIIGFMASCWVAISVVILSITENFSLPRIIFEVISAFGTVGLSTGITPHLSELGKLLLTITMLLGRVGPVTLGVSIMEKKVPQKPRYPEGTVWVG